MKYFSALTLLIVFSCNTSKNSMDTKAKIPVATNDQTKTPKEPISNPSIVNIPKEEVKVYTGSVNLKDTLCGVTITMKNNDLGDFHPINLDSKYKIQGLKINFQATPSRAQTPSGCMILPMAVSEVSLVK